MGCLPPFSTGDSDFAGPSTVRAVCCLDSSLKCCRLTMGATASDAFGIEPSGGNSTIYLYSSLVVITHY